MKLVTERGAAMQVCAESHEGTMAAILGLDDELVESACHRLTMMYGLLTTMCLAKL